MQEKGTIQNITVDAIESIIDELSSKFDISFDQKGEGDSSRPSGGKGKSEGGNSPGGDKPKGDKKGDNKKEKRTDTSEPKDDKNNSAGTDDNKENKDPQDQKNKSDRESKKKMLDDINKSIEELKKLGSEDKSIQDLIEKLEKMKDELEKDLGGGSSDDDSASKEKPKGDIKKKVYNPDLSSQSGAIDETFARNMEHDHEVSGRSSNVKNFINSFISSTELDVAVFAEYLLDTLVKNGMAMNSMFENFSQILSNPLPESKVVERSRAPIQAINIESFRQVGEDSPTAVVTNVMAKESEPSYSHLVKSIVISLDTSGSMHSFFTKALDSPNEVVSLYRSISSEFQKAAKKTELYKLIEEGKFDFESKEHQEIVKKTLDILSKETGKSKKDTNEFLTVFLLSILSRLDYISASFDHFMGIINAAESPYGSLFGLPIIRKNNEGAYYLEFSMREALTDGELSKDVEKVVVRSGNTKQMLYLRHLINTFMTYLSAGNDPAYRVGYSWGVFFKTVISISGLFNYFMHADNVISSDYSYCIGIMHVTDLYYDFDDGFVKGFYDGLSSNDRASVYLLTKVFEYRDAYSMFIVDEAYNKKVSLPQELTENTVLPKETLLKLISNLNMVNTEFKNGKLFVYVKEKDKQVLVSRVNVIFSDLSIFSFGDRGNDLYFFEREMNQILDLKHIKKMKEETLKEVINTVGFRSLLPNKLIVNQEDVSTIFAIMLSSMLIRYKLVSEIQRDLSNASVSDAFLHRSLLEYMREVKKSILSGNRTLIKKILSNINVTNKPLVMSYREDFDELALLEAVKDKNAYINLIRSAFDTNISVTSTSSHGVKVEPPKSSTIGFISGPAAF